MGQVEEGGYQTFPIGTPGGIPLGVAPSPWNVVKPQEGGRRDDNTPPQTIAGRLSHDGSRELVPARVLSHENSEVGILHQCDQAGRRPVRRGAAKRCNMGRWLMSIERSNTLAPEKKTSPA